MPYNPSFLQQVKSTDLLLLELAMTASAFNLLLSFFGAAVLIVVPAASILLWVSQKDSLNR